MKQPNIDEPPLTFFDFNRAETNGADLHGAG
jgi:hypothetical protein